MCPNSVFINIDQLKPLKPFDKQNYILHPQRKRTIQKSTCLVQKSTLAFSSSHFLTSFLFLYSSSLWHWSQLGHSVTFCSLFWFCSRNWRGKVCIMFPGNIIAIPEVALIEKQASQRDIHCIPMVCCFHANLNYWYTFGCQTVCPTDQKANNIWGEKKNSKTTVGGNYMD